MPTPRGDILDHGAEVEPVLRSTHVTVRADFVHRAMRRRFRTPLKQQHPRGLIVSTPGPMARQAVVKVWQPSPKTTSSHLSYLIRDGAGDHGQRAELFTAPDREVDRKAFVDAATDDLGQYRMLLSVADHHIVHLPTLTRALMQQVEHDVLQADVQWVAAVHGGQHPHVHLLMRGVDANGQQVHFTHDYRLRSLRYQVQTLLTRWLGEANSPADPKDLDAWAEAHLKETQLMIDPSAQPEEQQPIRPQTIAANEAQRRLQETRERMQHTIGRINARYGPPTPLTEVSPQARVVASPVPTGTPSVPPVTYPTSSGGEPNPKTQDRVSEAPQQKTLTTEEVHRRLEETRQRMQQTIGRMNARYGVQTPASTAEDMHTRVEQLKARLSREAQQAQVRMQQATTPDRDPDGSRGMDVS